MKPECCVVECEKVAEWEIRTGQGPDDYTHACTAHVGDLLTDAEEHRVYPVSEEEGG